MVAMFHRTTVRRARHERGIYEVVGSAVSRCRFGVGSRADSEVPELVLVAGVGGRASGANPPA